MRARTAYLIVICEKGTNKILQAEIWSSPEWEQSRQLPDVHTYVAYSVDGPTFHDAMSALIRQIGNRSSRYNYLFGYLPKLAVYNGTQEDPNAQTQSDMESTQGPLD